MGLAILAGLVLVGAVVALGTRKRSSKRATGVVGGVRNVGVAAPALGPPYILRTLSMPNHAGLPHAFVRADGLFRPSQLTADPDTSRHDIRATDAQVAEHLRGALVGGRYSVLEQHATKWGKWDAQTLRGLATLADGWSEEIDRAPGGAARAGALLPELVYARDMFAAMANTISAVYRGDRSDAQAFAEEAKACAARGWEDLAATGAAAVTALATGIAAGTITVASVSTAVVSGAAAAAAAVPVAGAIVLVAILIRSEERRA